MPFATIFGAICSTCWLIFNVFVKIIGIQKKPNGSIEDVEKANQAAADPATLARVDELFKRPD